MIRIFKKPNCKPVEPLKNRKINEFEIYENLMKLVSQKVELEKNNKNRSDEYLDIEENIKNITDSLSVKNIKFIEKLFKQEYENLLNVYSSDISGGVPKYVKNQLDVVNDCLKITNTSIDEKTTPQQTA